MSSIEEPNRKKPKLSPDFVEDGNRQAEEQHQEDSAETIHTPPAEYSNKASMIDPSVLARAALDKYKSALLDCKDALAQMEQAGDHQRADQCRKEMAAEMTEHVVSPAQFFRYNLPERFERESDYNELNQQLEEMDHAVKKTHEERNARRKEAFSVLLNQKELWIEGIFSFLGMGHYAFVAPVSKRISRLYKKSFVRNRKILPWSAFIQGVLNFLQQPKLPSTLRRSTIWHVQKFGRETTQKTKPHCHLRFVEPLPGLEVSLFFNGLLRMDSHWGATRIAGSVLLLPNTGICMF
ncbi:expressed unknown protein [Seminavis robusta]|uniref:Uncharacterized protein n=1 Tax=Seminavis robusta TaxID=568900 RepID=A0A9N8F3M9_9STRA|nr:expressed unknown protein [Seminavis robusta]|eukprot:Sro3532_g348980.1 n/a (294) ;mRNA; f:1842-2723